MFSPIKLLGFRLVVVVVTSRCPAGLVVSFRVPAIPCCMSSNAVIKADRTTLLFRLLLASWKWPPLLEARGSQDGRHGR